MDATKAIYLQVRQARKMWQELWWAMASGVKSEYDKIKSTPVFEFWAIFDLWKAEIKKQRDHLKAKNKANARK